MEEEEIEEEEEAVIVVEVVQVMCGERMDNKEIVEEVEEEAEVEVVMKVSTDQEVREDSEEAEAEEEAEVEADFIRDMMVQEILILSLLIEPKVLENTRNKLKSKITTTVKDITIRDPELAMVKMLRREEPVKEDGETQKKTKNWST